MKKPPYIEPTIRTIAGALILVCALLIYGYPQLVWAWVLLLFFLGFNLFQSGLTKFCTMEMLLKKIGLQSELDEIGKLSEARAKAEARAAYLDTISLLNEVVIELSADGRLLNISDRWNKLLGSATKDATHFIGHHLSEYLNSHDRHTLDELLAELSRTEHGIAHLRFRMLREDHVEHWVEGKFAAHHQRGRMQGIRGVLRDVTDSHLQEKRITHMATHDALTNLPNRLFLDEQMAHEIDQVSATGTKLAVLFIDLDNFKQINDIHGHKSGDQLLVDVSGILRSCLRQTDTLARWGGDEFVVLLPGIQQVDEARRLAKGLMRELHGQLAEKYADTHVTLSIGIAAYPDDADSSETLLMQADKALFFAKSQGRNNVQMFSEIERGSLGYKDVDMTSRFTAAVKQGLIQVHYQPIVDAKTEEVVAMEALARWHDDEYGWVSPCTFIPMAENLGLISDVGHQVMDQALQHFTQCSVSCTGLKLSINVSKRQLMAGNFFESTLSLLRRYNVSPSQLRLEITESIELLHIGNAIACIRKLADAGLILSLDDFGTGYSSLSYLHELPFKELKIDISFVRRLKTPEGRAIIRTIVELGHAMKLSLVAEGVEDRETADILRELGVEMLQGYLYAQPMPREECMLFAQQRLPLINSA